MMFTITNLEFGYSQVGCSYSTGEVIWSRILVSGYLDYPYPPDGCINEEQRIKAESLYQEATDLFASIHLGDADLSQKKGG